MMESFCPAVKDTPTRVSAVMPLTGSLSALPSKIADPEASPPIFAAMFADARVAWSKILFGPAFLMFVLPVQNVRPLLRARKIPVRR